MLRAQGNTLQRCSTFLPPLSLLHHPQRSEGSCQSSPRLDSDVNIEQSIKHHYYNVVDPGRSV